MMRFSASMIAAAVLFSALCFPAAADVKSDIKTESNTVKKEAAQNIPKIQNH